MLFFTLHYQIHIFCQNCIDCPFPTFGMHTNEFIFAFEFEQIILICCSLSGTVFGHFLEQPKWITGCIGIFGHLSFQIFRIRGYMHFISRSLHIIQAHLPVKAIFLFVAIIHFYSPCSKYNIQPFLPSSPEAAALEYQYISPIGKRQPAGGVQHHRPLPRPDDAPHILVKRCPSRSRGI